jgi:ClpP class serine protease
VKRRSNMAPQRYAPPTTSELAVDPRAFFELFIVPSSRESELIGDTCVVDICGPLDTHDLGWGDSYDAIKRRVAEACTSAAKSIVLRVDSPGGSVTGCFDTARALRAMCVAAGKPLYAYCDYACSAGYALAASATHGVVMSETANVGSIGCVQPRIDYTAANAAHGVRYEFIASGARKLDGNPDVAITDAELAETRGRVNYVAKLFFQLIEETRGIGVARIEAMQAGVFHAEAALRERLIDGVMSFETLLARVASGENLMPTPFEKARAALEEAAKGDDANAAVAKKALAAMAVDDGGDDADDKDKDKDAAEGDDDKPDAEGADASTDAAADDTEPTDTPPGKKKDDTGAAASATDAHSIAVQALAKSHELEAKLANRDARDERKALLAKRPDFDATLRAELMKATTPIATVRNLVKTLPRKPVSKAAAAAAATAAGTRGESQGDTTTAGSSPNVVANAERTERQSRMGLTEARLAVVRDTDSKGVTTALKFGVVEEPYKRAAASGEAGGAK